MTAAWRDERAYAWADVQMWLAERDRYSGQDRDDSRAELRRVIAHWRRFHGDPERAAFERTVAVQRARRIAA